MFKVKPTFVGNVCVICVSQSNISGVKTSVYLLFYDFGAVVCYLVLL